MSTDPTRQAVLDLGPLQVAVRTDEQRVIDYLRAFYTVIEDTPERQVTAVIEARLAEPEPGMGRTRWNVGYRASSDRSVLLCGTELTHLAITTRKVAREPLLAFCADRGGLMLHAAALADEQRLVVLVGDAGAGKTSVALNGVLRTRMWLVSNDHLLLYRDGSRLVATSLPTPIPVKIGTYAGYAAELGRPWHGELTALTDSWRLSPQQRNDQTVYVTYPHLGQPNPVHVDVARRRVLVALIDFAAPDEPARELGPVPDPVAALWPHVRHDWIESPGTGFDRYLFRSRRSAPEHDRDAQQQLRALAATAPVVRWRHHGVLGPLHDWHEEGR